MYTFKQVVEEGQKVQAQGRSVVNEPTPDDVYLLSYTSGTTGDPKGVKVSHKMMVQNVYAMKTRLTATGAKEFDEADSYISYLPPAHVFEQILLGISMIYGMSIGFFGGNVLKLTEDM